MKRSIRCSMFLLLAMSLMLAPGCAANAGSAGSGLPGLQALRGAAHLEGVWYEQAPYGDVVTISGNTLLLERSFPSGDSWSEETAFRLQPSGTYLELVPEEEYFAYIDLWYDAEEEQLLFHTLPHTDGDGGYHTVVFLKSEYTPPPEPVYGERTDRSDPSAPHSFASHAVRALSLHVYEPYIESYDMAPELPTEGEYSYTLEVRDDGSAWITSDFYDGGDGSGVRISADRLHEIETLLAESGLDAVNGVDIWTAEMPEDTQFYELTIEYDDGAAFASRANGKDIPDIWINGTGRELHRMLFDSILEAGYNWGTGEFHSSEPMKRFGGDTDVPADYSLLAGLERIEVYGTEYDYKVYAEYPVFTLETAAGRDGSRKSRTGLDETLQKISTNYQQLAEENLSYDEEVMRTAPKAKRNSTGRSTTYSFYSAGQIRCYDSLVSFVITEGHSNALGLGQYGSGTYRMIRYCIDAETGQILSAADLFTDPDALTDTVMNILAERYDSRYFEENFYAENYAEKLARALRLPQSEGGAGIALTYNDMILYLSGETGRKDGSGTEVLLYYDSLQDIMNDRYAPVW